MRFVPEREFTLILTKGTHAISSSAAATIARALEDREPLVEVELDMFGAGDAPRPVTLVTAHVVAMSRNPLRVPPERLSAPEPKGNVTILRRSAFSTGTSR